MRRIHLFLISSSDVQELAMGCYQKRIWFALKNNFALYSANTMNNFTGKLKSRYFSYSNDSFVKLLMRLVIFFPSEDICCWNEARKEEGFSYNVQYTNPEMRLNYR